MWVHPGSPTSFVYRERGEGEGEIQRALMACSLDMFNTDQHQAFGAPLSPRISFSNDFVEAENLGSGGCITKRAGGASAPPEDADFEFSVSNNTMLTADQLFFQGRLLPFRDEGGRMSPCSAPHRGNKKMSTLKEELCAADEDPSPRPPKGCRRWKQMLGLKRASASVLAPKKNQIDIDIKEERKIWGWREEGDQSSYRWRIQEKKDVDQEEEDDAGRQEEGEPQQEENRAV